MKEERLQFISDPLDDLGLLYQPSIPSNNPVEDDDAFLKALGELSAKFQWGGKKRANPYQNNLLPF